MSEIELTIRLPIEKAAVLGEVARILSQAPPTSVGPAPGEADENRWSEHLVKLMWNQVTPDFREVVKAILNHEGSAPREYLTDTLGLMPQEFGGRLSSPGHQARRFDELTEIQGQRPFLFWDPETAEYRLQTEVEEFVRRILSEE